MAALGENVDASLRGGWDHAELARAIDALGVTWVRLVIQRDRDYRPLLMRLRASGHKILVVLDGDSIGRDAHQWPALIAWYVEKYGDLVDAWQPFNEPDADESSTHSWPMALNVLRAALEIVVPCFPPGTYVVGPGLCNTKGWYLDAIDWGAMGLSAIAMQVYGREHDEAFDDEVAALRFGIWEEILDRYAARAAALGMDLWVTEWGYIESEMGQLLAPSVSETVDLLASRADVAVACHFQIRMDGFGLLRPDGSKTAAYAAYVESVARWAEHTPEPPDQGGTTGMNLEELLAKHQLKTWPTGTGADVEHAGSDLVPIRKAMVDTQMDVWVEERAGYASFIHGSNSPKA